MGQSIERWQGYLQYFEQQDKLLEEEVAKSFAAFKDSKNSLNLVKEDTAKKDKTETDILEISDDEMGSEHKDPSASLTQDLTQMMETFKQLKARADAALEPQAKKQKLEVKQEFEGPPLGPPPEGFAPTKSTQPFGGPGM